MEGYETKKEQSRVSGGLSASEQRTGYPAHQGPQRMAARADMQGRQSHFSRIVGSQDGETRPVSCSGNGVVLELEAIWMGLSRLFFKLVTNELNLTWGG